LRQAYDYWQNQPGNYPEPTRERGTPPRRAADASVTTKVGPRKFAPSRDRQRRQRSRDDQRPIQLPPLSSPKDRPRREVSGPRAANLRHMCPSSGGGLRTDQAVLRAVIHRDQPPEHLFTDRSKANNPQTRKGACCRKTTGLRIPSTSPGAADRIAGRLRI
jgi:hypothetical protein